MATSTKKAAPAAGKPKKKPAKTPARARTVAAPARKAAAKPVAKTVAEPVTKTTPVPQQEANTDKADKAKKLKLVRDSFTIPKTEYAVLEAMKLRAAKLGRPTKKSEVLRAGVQALAAMGDAAFLSCVGSVPAVKTGRPAKA